MKSYFPIGIQIRTRAWEFYGLKPEQLQRHPESPLYPLRVLAGRMQERRPDRPVSTGSLNLLALLNRVFRFMANRHLELRRCTVGSEETDIAGRLQPLPLLRPSLEGFVRLFPPATALGKSAGAAFLEEENRRRNAVIELFVLATQMGNRAASPFSELFDDAELRSLCPYRQMLEELDRRLQGEAAHGIFSRPLLEILQDPIKASPDSLAGQLSYIQQYWATFIPVNLLREVLTAFDVLKEEELARGAGPGPIPVPVFPRDLEEPEAFSPDVDWMPNVVLIAKSVYVWMDQLSRRYGRQITRLDEIPEEELDILARWGFTALWLIGIWERSPASQKVKRIMGNPEAVSSAYSLYDYAVAADLGGDEALAVLEGRCQARGVRLASDVVPNHTGIYSRWMQEHPEWYIQLDHPPFPAYRFTGPDLSFDGSFGLFIEDGYYDHSDAAVVFKHVDRGTGRVRYIYHGNDGTHMPWNDTAQLNYLLPEVREAMIRTIIAVARRFRIIRFDAAMTLAKKHFQRLWFPQPGGGAGIPSRAEHWMRPEEFDRLFPVEFWREVVDRVAAEVPDTLLLAEAFWLMEGYFVRTLGMHRVYNSAFMNMLKQEENAKYRGVIRNILEFNPEILKRFVNFMNNPDEATAVEQFGKEDKYFGVAVLLATMPGLSMFGHGQIEGLREKYGMEYRRAYWDEAVDEAFVRHHEAQIFPLLRRRHLFSGAEHFQLYDFFSDGNVEENVFAYSNRCGEERALVVYHNRHGETGGWIRLSAPKTLRESATEHAPTVTTLGEGLGIASEEGWYCRFRDQGSGLEFLRMGKELVEQGMHLHLGPYQYRVFLDFREIFDQDGCWGELHRRLGGRPVPDLDREMRKIRYAPLIASCRRALEPELRRRLGEGLLLPEEARKEGEYLATFAGRLEAFLRELSRFASAPGDPRRLTEALLEELATVSTLASLKGRSGPERTALRRLGTRLPGSEGEEGRPDRFDSVFLPYLVLHRLGELAPGAAPAERSAAWQEEFLLGQALRETLPQEGEEEGALLVKLMVRFQRFFAPSARKPAIAEMLEDPEVQRLLHVHWHDGYRWFNKEGLEALFDWLFFVSAVEAVRFFRNDRPGLRRHIVKSHEELAACLELAERSGYRLDPFLEAMERQRRSARAAHLKARRIARKLKILLVASEAAPFAKTGGLADVAGSLPLALRDLGHDVRIALPYYRSVKEGKPPLSGPRREVEIPVGAVPRPARILQGDLDGVPVYFIDSPHFFDRPGLYADRGEDYPDNAERFGFFCRAVLESLPRLDFRPDVLHLNDWQTGLIPAMLRTEYRDDPFFASVATLLTIHNLGYQGSFPPEVLPALGLAPSLFSIEGLEYYGRVSFLKGGVAFADLLNTVSETYCREIRTPEMGIGFDGILRNRADALSGIVNGLDQDLWDPKRDRSLPRNYSAARPGGKAANKKALQAELGLSPEPDVPLVAMITRLATQKGLDLVEDAWEGLMKREVQFVLLGTGEPEHMERFARLVGRNPGRVSINLSFDDALARRIYAGSDLFLMPSHYEPCGLGQLIALRYGSIPLVRRTGGLADTVTDPTQDAERANGFSFVEPSARALLETLDRALDLFRDRKAWGELLRRGMGQDLSWRRSAERYVQVYRKAMERRDV